MVTRERFLLATATIAVAILTGCGGHASGNGTSAGVPGSTSVPGSAANAAAAKARADFTACVDKAGLTQLLTSSGRASLYSCLDNVVPPAARTTFRNCVTKAAISDEIWTSSGRAAFLNADGPNCLNAALA